MDADRIDYYANQLRGIPVADLGRKLREVLRDVANEAEAAEREVLAKHFDTEYGGTVLAGDEVSYIIRTRSNAEVTGRASAACEGPR